MAIREHTLENGLEIIAEVNERAYSAAYGFFVKAGSRDEAIELSGVSHFLEHMVFKGTANRSADQVNRELDEIGSQSNAYTSEEQTVFYAAVLPEYQDRTIELLGDMMRPALRVDDFETEKQVILEEIAKYDDQPPFGAFEKALDYHFSGHSLGRNILGSVKSVSDLQVGPMQGYFESHYCPRNISLIASGNVDFDRLVEGAKSHCSHWDDVPASHDPQRTSRVASHLSTTALTHELATQQYVVLVSDAPAADDEMRFAARVLATIVGDDSGSRMFWDMVDTGRADVAAMGPHEYEGTGVCLTYLCCQRDAVAENLAAIQRIFQTAERDGVTAQELEQAVNKICSQIVLSSERPMSRLFSVGTNWLSRREYTTVREVVQRYRNITLNDLHEVMARFPYSRHSAVAVGPNGNVEWPSSSS
ncbi:MAG: pitrilysin family protein [Pirellulaceae bacterium]